MLDYRHLGGSGALDYHPTPLIAEMASGSTSLMMGGGDNHHLPNNHLYHRSIDTLRALNERGQLFTVPHHSQPSPSAAGHAKGAHNANAAEDISNLLVYHSNLGDIGLSTPMYNGQTTTTLLDHLKSVDDVVVENYSPSQNSANGVVDDKLVIAKEEMDAIGRASSSSSPISRSGGGGCRSTTSSGPLLDPDIFIKQEDVSPVDGCKVYYKGKNY